MKKTLIISGGNIQRDFAFSYVKDRQYDFVIAADCGLYFALEAGLTPDYLVGDFDSISREELAACMQNPNVEVRRFPEEKDATDTQLAIELAIEKGSGCIDLLGASGSRIDHLMGNLQCMMIPLLQGIKCQLIDKYNRVTLLREGIKLPKAEQYGSYISLQSFTSHVSSLTLTGFKYPLYKHFLTNTESLGVSNEIVEETAQIQFKEGILMMTESREF